MNKFWKSIKNFIIKLVYYYKKIMATITIDNKEIVKKYSSYELKMKFLAFLENEMKQDKVEFYEVSVDDLPKEAKKKLENIDKLKFVDY